MSDAPPMQVRGLDHVNIIADDLDATARFYQQLLGLNLQSPAGGGRWLHDAAGRPIIHLMAHDPRRHGTLDRKSMPTGSIDHVALACEGFAATIERCERLGIAHRVNDRQFADLRQIFVTDPNNVLLELNFAGD